MLHITVIANEKGGRGEEEKKKHTQKRGWRHAATGGVRVLEREVGKRKEKRQTQKIICKKVGATKQRVPLLCLLARWLASYLLLPTIWLSLSADRSTFRGREKKKVKGACQKAWTKKEIQWNLVCIHHLRTLHRLSSPEPEPPGATQWQAYTCTNKEGSLRRHNEEPSVWEETFLSSILTSLVSYSIFFSKLVYTLMCGSLRMYECKMWTQRRIW